MKIKKYIASLLLFIIVNLCVYSKNNSLLSIQQTCEEIHNWSNNQNTTYLEDDEECEWDFDTQSVHSVVISSDSEILDIVISFIELSKEMFIPDKYNIFLDSNYCLNISIQPTFGVVDDFVPVFEIAKNASYFIDVTYHNEISILDRYLFKYDKYRFSSFSYIVPWYKTNVCEFSTVDNYNMNDFFICWSFEVYCGNIKKAYLIDGFCEYLVYDLISSKESTMEDYITNILNRKFKTTHLY